MRRLWIVMAVVLAFGGLAVFATGAGAASTPSPKFCAAVDKIGTASSNLTVGSQATKLAAQFKAAAKSAPSKSVKNAMKRIGNFIGSLGSSDASALAKIYTSKGFKTYMTDIGTYAGAVAECSAS